jgi:pimeloyl-ACP methyl ester carboxylesterase
VTTRIEEAELSIDGVRVFYRRVTGEGTPTVYCHGNPTHGEDWIPFMERGSGPSIAIDMPGWGRSDKPDPARFDYSMIGLGSFVERCLEELGVGRRNLVVHDWGDLMLIPAQARAEQLRKLVVMNGVPFTPGYRWHWVAQIWRRRPLGEIFNATQTRPSMALALRQATGDRSAMPAELVDSIWNYWDRGTSRAMLRLYRYADPARLVAAGRDLGRIDCPALVIWGDRDPYIPVKFGEAFAAALGNAELETREGVGHWPWIDDPSVVDRVVEYLEV